MILFTVSENKEKRDDFRKILISMRQLKMAVGCLWLHPKYSLGLEKKINLWLRDQSPNNDLAILCALQFARNWGAELNLCRVVESDDMKKQTVRELVEFIEEARLPANTKVRVYSGEFCKFIHSDPADLSILGMPLKYEVMMEIMDNAPGSMFFVASGGLENALI